MSDATEQDGQLDVTDALDRQEVVESTHIFTGRVWDVRSDTVRLSDGAEVVREYIDHPGAVCVIALDDQDRVALVRQYRHPVGSYLWEAPAGLIDVEDEPPLITAQRELYEEAHLRAGTWHLLLDYYNSPGASSEMLRCFLARDVSAADGDRHTGEGEEKSMPLQWVPLDELLERTFAGKIHNLTTVAGILATVAARSQGWASLRPADIAWPERFPDGLPGGAA